MSEGPRQRRGPEDGDDPRPAGLVLGRVGGRAGDRGLLRGPGGGVGEFGGGKLQVLVAVDADQSGELADLLVGAKDVIWRADVGGAHQKYGEDTVPEARAEIVEGRGVASEV